MVYLIALVPAFLVYIVAAVSRSKATLYWTALAAMSVGAMGPPSYFLLDVGAVLFASFLALTTLNLKGRPVDERDPAQWPLNPGARDLLPRASNAPESPVFGPAQWRAEAGSLKHTYRPPVAPARPATSSQTSPLTHFTYRYVASDPRTWAKDGRQPAPITAEARAAYQKSNLELMARFSLKYPKYDFSQAYAPLPPGVLEELTDEDKVYIELRRHAAIAARKLYG